jgi:hypothetical protein
VDPCAHLLLESRKRAGEIPTAGALQRSGQGVRPDLKVTQDQVVAHAERAQPDDLLDLPARTRATLWRAGLRGVVHAGYDTELGRVGQRLDGALAQPVAGGGADPGGFGSV